MRSNYQAALQFVKSKAMSMVKIRSSENDLLPMLNFAEKLFPEKVIMMCERTEHPRVSYVSENCTKVFGYDAQLIRQLSIQEFMDLIHPEDIQGVHQCFGFINASEPYDPLRYRFEMQYRIKNKNGDYMHMSDEKMVIQNTDGSHMHLNLFTNITSHEKFHDVKLNISQKNIEGTYKSIYTFNPRQSSTTFTPRQKDILNLISKGFTNNEIADRLSVSVNTIKNHKNLLFKKANVKNSIELASIAWKLNAH